MMTAKSSNFVVIKSSEIESSVMFEVQFQTYWSDADAAGIVFFPHFFRFVEQAEEELFRAAGEDRQSLLEANRVWMPRVEAFARFSKPVRHCDAIRVRLTPQLKGEKTVRYDFEILDDQSRDQAAEGYVTVVCVDAASFKATPIPDAIRNIIQNWLTDTEDHG
jgi:YbgC/YbaW family acyl-CoA thioester hydrolase